MDTENERNINNIPCSDLYHSPMKKKDVSTINDSVYNESDEHVDTISDSIKQVEPINNPIKETHVVDGVRTLSIGVRIPSQPSSESLDSTARTLSHIS